MSFVTEVTNPKKAKKMLRSIAQGMIEGPPEKIEELRKKCLDIIQKSNTEFKPKKN